MSNISSLLESGGIHYNVKAACKREALQALSEIAAPLIDVPAADVLSVVMERERLGSTGVGNGVAIPHGKVNGLTSISGILVRLETPIGFDALDDLPVDLIFMLLAPNDATAAHLKALAVVSRLLRDPETRRSLRGADSAEAMFAIATRNSHSDAA